MKKANKRKFPLQFHLQPYYGSENTGVKAFEIGNNYIVVEYKDGRIYLYNDEFPGEEPLQIMKQKAKKGDKLGSYINTEIKNNYAAQWDHDSKIFKPNRKVVA
jgi:hypothetical protein